MDTFDEKNQSCRISRYCTFKRMSVCKSPKSHLRKSAILANKQKLGELADQRYRSSEG
jgi:hypothetical protein